MKISRGEGLICSRQSPVRSPAATLPSNQLLLMSAQSVPSAIQVRLERRDRRVGDSAKQKQHFVWTNGQSPGPCLTWKVAITTEQLSLTCPGILLFHQLKGSQPLPELWTKGGGNVF